VKQRFQNYELTQSLISPTYFNITDAKGFIESFSCIYRDKSMILWIDTPYLVEFGCNMKKAKVYTTSEYVKGLINNITHVDGILRPPYNLVAEQVRKEDVKKENLFVIVGAEPKGGKIIRKRIEYTVNVLREMGLRKLMKVVSNVGDYDIPAFTLDTEDLYRLLYKSYFYVSLSKSEGFGLPLMEAMSVGVPAVYVNAYSYKEFAVGIPVDPYDVIVEETGMLKMENYLIKDNDVKEALKEAQECVVRKSCYEDLSKKALEKSKEFAQYNLEEKIISDLKGIMSNNKS
jgi:glycosyltransferase involved in cell wall biosynthesis